MVILRDDRLDTRRSAGERSSETLSPSGSTGTARADSRCWAQPSFRAAEHGDLIHSVSRRAIQGIAKSAETATKNLGDRVEIRIRDNGTGIPPEVKEKLFNPFFTTKPAGEGTGLGLSISHDIIVKQHGGSIEVDTQPGAFTEFRIILPRTGKAL